jgi:PDZ domain-containing secreted protein
MKTLSLTLLLCFIFTLGYSKDPEEKTFLVIFNKAELKANKTSAGYIELSLMNLFQTKSYAGNSDAAIIVKIPNASIDKCQLGDFIIRVNQNKVSQLDEIAFKIYDMDESKEAYQELISAFEKKNQKPEKNAKPIPAS